MTRLLDIIVAGSPARGDKSRPSMEELRKKSARHRHWACKIGPDPYEVDPSNRAADRDGGSQAQTLRASAAPRFPLKSALP